MDAKQPGFGDGEGGTRVAKSGGVANFLKHLVQRKCTWKILWTSDTKIISVYNFVPLLENNFKLLQEWFYENHMVNNPDNATT